MKFSYATVVLLLIVSALLVGAWGPFQPAPPVDPAWVGQIIGSLEAAQFWVQYGAGGEIKEMVFSTRVVGVPFVGQLRNWKIVQLGYTTELQASQAFMLLHKLKGWTSVDFWTLTPTARLVLTTNVAVRAAALKMANMEMMIVGAMVGQAYSVCPVGVISAEEYNEMGPYDQRRCNPTVRQ